MGSSRRNRKSQRNSRFSKRDVKRYNKHGQYIRHKRQQIAYDERAKEGDEPQHYQEQLDDDDPQHYQEQLDDDEPQQDDDLQNAYDADQAKFEKQADREYKSRIQTTHDKFEKQADREYIQRKKEFRLYAEDTYKKLGDTTSLHQLDDETIKKYEQALHDIIPNYTSVEDLAQITAKNIQRLVEEKLDVETN